MRELLTQAPKLFFNYLYRFTDAHLSQLEVDLAKNYGKMTCNIVVAAEN